VLPTILSRNTSLTNKAKDSTRQSFTMTTNPSTSFTLMYLSDAQDGPEMFTFQSQEGAFAWQQAVDDLKHSIAGINEAHADIRQPQAYNGALLGWLRHYNHFVTVHTLDKVPRDVFRAQLEIVEGVTAAGFEAPM
jgi:hypothetical protein